MADVQDVSIWSGTEWISLEGPQGSPGVGATVDVGTTTTSAPGSDAEVTNVGTSQNAEFNFVIPRGETGPDGTAGTQQVGKVETIQLNPGSNNSVIINNSGTQTAAVWDYTFSLAPGEKGEDGTGVNILGEKPSEGDLPATGNPGDAWLISGDLWVWDVENGSWVNAGSIQGPPGPDGNAATVSATASSTTAECNEDASVVVTNNGNASAAQFAFAFDIPRGCDGQKGDPGKDGENSEVFVQNATPTAKAAGAIWIQTQP